jgi:hypothetical protein
MYKRNKSIKKEMKTIDKQAILEMKNIISEVKNPLEFFNNRFNQPEEELANLKTGHLKLLT